MIKQRTCFVLSIFVICVLLISISSCKNEVDHNPKPKPNVILIITDDQGWGDLSVNGNQFISTPNIDNLANQGIQFNRFYVSPVCSPTRAELLTGRYHTRGGVYATSQGGERLDLDEITIAEIFKTNGYRTAAFGKWHNGSQGPFHPNSRGFDEFYGFCSGHWGNYFSPMLEHNGAVVKGDGFIIDDFTNKALEYIKLEKDKPFFSLIAYNTPHSPMQVPDQWWDKYKNELIDTTHLNADKENKDKTKAAYALCENIDWNVGRILQELDSLNILENTIVVFMSDNGPNGWRWNDGLKGIKGHTDEGGVRSPFIVYWKDKFQAKQIDEVAAAIDILPTFIDLFNLENKRVKKLDGKSLKPLLDEEARVWEDRYVFSHWHGRVSVRNQKYILDHEGQLFDLSIDPGQGQVIENPPDSVFIPIKKAKEYWKKNVLSELNPDREEVFPVGKPGGKWTQLPARDGIAHGNIIRSNRWPNSSFFTNWIADTDSISWDCDVLKSGHYKATIYYTCKASALGSNLILQQNNNSIEATIDQAHDPPFNGVEFDRVKRAESYEKDFKPLELGTIQLDKGKGKIILKTSKINGPTLIDFRLLVLEAAN